MFLFIIYKEYVYTGLDTQYQTQHSFFHSNSRDYAYSPITIYYITAPIIQTNDNLIKILT